jgi:hypothetical protein
MCVSCDDTYRISSYDGNYEKIIKKRDITTNEIGLKSDKNLPKSSKIILKSTSLHVDKDIGNNNDKVINNQNENIDMNKKIESLKPLFDLSDAPILDFSTTTTGLIYIDTHIHTYI